MCGTDLRRSPLYIKQHYYYQSRTKEGVLFADFPNGHSASMFIIEFHTDCVRAATGIGLCAAKITPITMN